MTAAFISNSNSKIRIPDVIAHRGFSGENPENTIISYKNAILAGATALEGDIRLTKDNEIIMMHDLKLDRTTNGTGLIREANYSNYIDGLNSKGEPIPRFKDVLDLLIHPDTGKDLYMIVDIKFDTPIEILDVLKELLDSYKEEYPQLQDKLILGVWNLEYLEKTKVLFPQIKLCFIGVSINGARAHFLKSVDCVSIAFDVLAADGSSFIEEVHSLNKKVFTWTINDPQQMKTCVLWGVDGVIGDHVTKLLENTHTIPKLITSDEEYQEYVKSNTFLASRSTRVYYYLRSKVFSFVSKRWIGV